MTEINKEQIAQVEAMKKEMLRKVLTKKALERMGRVKIANPMLAAQLEVYLIQLHQSGKMTESVTDEQLKQILNVLTPKKRKTKIKRK